MEEKNLLLYILYCSWETPPNETQTLQEPEKSYFEYYDGGKKCCIMRDGIIINHWSNKLIGQIAALEVNGETADYYFTGAVENKKARSGKPIKYLFTAVGRPSVLLQAGQFKKALGIK